VTELIGWQFSAFALAGLLCRIHPMPLRTKWRPVARYGLCGHFGFQWPTRKLRQSKTWRLAYAAAAQQAKKPT
jgi:hypothetical protein